MRKLRLVLTDNCNFTCPFCYNEGNKSKNQNNFLKFNVLKKFIKSVKGNYKLITLTGGEPLLYKKFNRLVKFLSKNGMEIQLTTNGSLLHKVRPSILKKFNNINISFDNDEATSFRYKCNTNSSLYEIVKRNIVMCSHKYNNVVLNTVFDENITQETILKLLKLVKENQLKAIKFIPLVDRRESICLYKLYSILFKKLKLNSKKSKQHDLIEEYDQDDYKILILRQYCNNDCGVCKEISFVRINYDGRIYPCMKNHDKFLKIEDLVKERNSQKIIDIIEEGFRD